MKLGRQSGILRPGPRGALGWGSIAGVLLLLYSPSGVGIACGQDPPTQQQVDAWVKELDANQFEVRTRATEQLIKAGAVAVPAVSAAVEQGKLEVSMRAVYVLRELATCMDFTAQQEGLEALEKIAGAGQNAAARMAEKAIVQLGDLRQKQAIEQLTNLGATVRGYSTGGFVAGNMLEIEIGKAWTGTRDDLRRLEWVRDLTKISFVGDQVKDSWIKTIQDASRLNYIAIKSADVTDESLRIIGQLKMVIYVDLMYVPVTNAGLNHLKTMKSVRKIRCFGTRITREATQQFQTELASVVVQHKRGAFLGVRCQQPPLPCGVVEVTPASAAKMAGVKEGDIIVRYDQKPVRGFDELEKLIAQNRVGDSVEIEVVRGGKPWFGMLPTPSKDPLGIEGEATEIGTKVLKVAKNSRAAKAGIRVGDLIIAMDDVPAVSVDELEKLLKKEVPLRQRQVEILRDVKKLKMRVTFGEWNEL